MYLILVLMLFCLFSRPFKLKPPAGGFKKRKKHFADGGSAGNSEFKINKLVARML